MPGSATHPHASDAALREPVGRARSKDSQPEIFADPLFRGLNPG